MVSVPQQGLLIMNYADKITTYGYWAKFPSPTGVSYYESDYIFRTTMRIIKTAFRPQQGLLIMNKQVIYDESRSEGFRPQQGLLIMNRKMCDFVMQITKVRVSVPNRGYLL